MDKIVPDLLPLAVDIKTIKPDPANAREGHNIDGIAGSLAKYGQRKPIVVNKTTGIVEAGNGTYQAAIALNWSRVAVVMVEDDPVTSTGYSIADNRLGDQSHFNPETLALILQSVDNPMREIPGIDEEWLQSVLNEAGINNDDPPDVDFKEYDESVENEVEYITCPHCGEKFPK